MDVNKCMTKASLQLQCDSVGGTEPQVHNFRCSWTMNYTVLSLMMNGHLCAEYSRLSGMLGLPHCSNQQWLRIIGKLEEKVTELAEWSCHKVCEAIKQRGDEQDWVASYDGFYLTRGHYSNNLSATLHDYVTGDIARFQHRNKEGVVTTGREHQMVLRAS